ncbi:MAG: disulfide bond formation protein B [Cereibacter sphaeroides]|uniref:Disulfide bond formation protein B n=1 Tax=Cereibacter sphaeroides TaxID=1063 RepID=A0A2W5SJR0_CERSP|nr:MAG: disulfide bond formation protein B [Cereibacter sphaeroides]
MGWLSLQGLAAYGHRKGTDEANSVTTRKGLISIATAGSALLLLGALAFQYLGGLAPCHLCILQRWPHLAAVLIGLVALMVPGRLLPLFGAAAALITAGIGLYHTGVERLWWQGPTSCSAGSIAGIDMKDLLDPTIVVAPVVRCDQVAWEMLGLSMASWNMLASLVLAVIWLMAARRS